MIVNSNQWELLNALSDEELAARLVAGENESLGVLFDRYNRLVFTIALRMVLDQGEAEEVVQTVFLDVYRAVASFDASKGIFKTWLLQYAYHRAIHRKRYLNSSRFYEQVEIEAALGSWPEVSRFDSAETVQLVRSVLAGLTPRQREVIELTYFEGLTAQEVADRLDRSINTVRHNLHRGLTSMRKALNRNEDDVRQARKKEAFAADA